MRNLCYVTRQGEGWVYSLGGTVSPIYGMQSMAEVHAIEAMKLQHKQGDHSEVLVQRSGGLWRCIWSSDVQT